MQPKRKLVVIAGIFEKLPGLSRVKNTDHGAALFL
jgi:hypothetical protein